MITSSNFRRAAVCELARLASYFTNSSTTAGDIVVRLEYNRKAAKEPSMVNVKAWIRM
jgi:hypothetical protein